MSNPFKKAVKEAMHGRIALVGPSGSGKTWTALAFAAELAGEEGKVAVIDTEYKSATKYADQFEFDVVELDNFHPGRFVDLLKLATQNGYDVVVIDSLSHEWEGPGGIMEMVDKAANNSRSSNKFAAWSKATPLHKRLVEAIIRFPGHIICTMRTKTEYVIEKDSRGKNVPRKVGLAPVQRAGIEHEFDLVIDIDQAHQMTVSKTRCPAMDGLAESKDGADIAGIRSIIRPFAAWLGDGVEPAENPEPAQANNPLVNNAMGIIDRATNAQSPAEFAEANKEAREIWDQLKGYSDVRARLKAALEEAGTRFAA